MQSPSPMRRRRLFSAALLACSFGIACSRSSKGERTIPALSHACATKLPAAEVDTIVKLLTGFAGDPRPELREAVAGALGRTGMPSARPSLRMLATDAFTTGGRICRTGTDGTERCSPDRPVRQAAEAGLERVREAEARRVEERERARRQATASPKNASPSPSPR